MTHNRSTARKAGSVFLVMLEWLAIGAVTIGLVSSLIEGDILYASVWAAVVMAGLLHATGLSTRSAVATRVGTVLWVLAAVLMLIKVASA